jgi:hypothetical protein
VNLPPNLADAVRQVARQAAVEAVRAYAVPRAEVLDLMAALAPPLGAEDEAALAVLLPWLHARRAGDLVLAAEVVALAHVDATPPGAAVRAALAGELQAHHPSKALGRLLKRCAWRPVAGFYIRCVPPGHRRDSALFEVLQAG